MQRLRFMQMAWPRLSHERAAGALPASEPKEHRDATVFRLRVRRVHRGMLPARRRVSGTCRPNSAGSTSICSISSLRGRFDRRARILDAGCGEGRTCLSSAPRFEVYAADASPHAIAAMRQLAGALQVNLPEAAPRIRIVGCAPVAERVARRGHLQRRPALRARCGALAAMVRELWRVLARGGLFFARLATSIGIEHHLTASIGRVLLPDGSERYVVDERTLLETTAAIGGTLVDPIKTTNVQNLRCMTTWVVEK